MRRQSICPVLNQVLDCVVNPNNFIKTRPLIAKFLKKLREGMGAKQLSLLYCSNARWLSVAIFYYVQEIKMFLKDEGHKDAEDFSENDFLINLV